MIMLRSAVFNVVFFTITFGLTMIATVMRDGFPDRTLTMPMLGPG